MTDALPPDPEQRAPVRPDPPGAASGQLAGGDPAVLLALEPSMARASYVDPDEFVREQCAVLAADWCCVGRVESLPAPGDYLLADVAGERVIVVRKPDGTICAFYNLCRHRGSRLVDPASAASPQAIGPDGRFDRAIRCPYHAWTYATDGRLVGAPFLPTARLARDVLSLHPVAAATWGGFVFVCLDPCPSGTAADLAASLGAVPGRLDRYELDRLRIGTRLIYKVRANYKVILENYNECYHCGPVHPELCALVPAFARGGADLDWNAGIPHRHGAFTFTASGTTVRPPLPRLDDAERTRHKGELVLPNLMLSCSADHVAAFTLWPRSVDETTVVCDFLFDPDEIAKDGFDPSDAVDFWDMVNRQDWWICEQVQDGMSSRRFDSGYLGPMEQPSADIGRHVRRRTGPPAASGQSGN
jgi:glycine betaine catabolism A